jgi:hypothetical protein
MVKSNPSPSRLRHSAQPIGWKSEGMMIWDMALLQPGASLDTASGKSGGFEPGVLDRLCIGTQQII